MILYILLTAFFTHITYLLILQHSLHSHKILMTIQLSSNEYILICLTISLVLHLSVNNTLHFVSISYLVTDEQLHLCSFLMFEVIIAIARFNDILITFQICLTVLYTVLHIICENTVFLSPQFKLNIIVKVLLIELAK